MRQDLYDFLRLGGTNQPTQSHPTLVLMQTNLNSIEGVWIRYIPTSIGNLIVLVENHQQWYTYCFAWPILANQYMVAMHQIWDPLLSGRVQHTMKHGGMKHGQEPTWSNGLQPFFMVRAVLSLRLMQMKGMISWTSLHWHGFPIHWQYCHLCCRPKFDKAAGEAPRFCREVKTWQETSAIPPSHFRSSTVVWWFYGQLGLNGSSKTLWGTYGTIFYILYGRSGNTSKPNVVQESKTTASDHNKRTEEWKRLAKLMELQQSWQPSIRNWWHVRCFAGHRG